MFALLAALACISILFAILLKEHAERWAPYWVIGYSILVLAFVYGVMPLPSAESNWSVGDRGTKRVRRQWWAIGGISCFLALFVIPLQMERLSLIDTPPKLLILVGAFSGLLLVANFRVIARYYSAYLR